MAIERVLSELRDKVNAKNRRLDSMKQTIIDEGERNLVIEEFNFYRSEWRSRKEKCLSVVDQLADGMDKSRAAVVV